MGLDQYIRVKTKASKNRATTGACNGLFDTTPESNEFEEIGYLRKAYDQGDLILQYSNYDGGEDNCVDILIPNENVDKIIAESKNILNTHCFDEEGFDLDSDDGSTLYSKEKWEDVIKFFTEIKEIIAKDPTTEVYYCQWY